MASDFTGVTGSEVDLLGGAPLVVIGTDQWASRMAYIDFLDYTTQALLTRESGQPTPIVHHCLAVGATQGAG